MKKIYNGRGPRGIKVLFITGDQEQFNDSKMIQKTISRIIKIGGYAPYSCRQAQLKEKIKEIKPQICIVLEDVSIEIIRKLIPECKVIRADFMCSIYQERRAIMLELEQKLSDIKGAKEISHPSTKSISSDTNCRKQEI